MESATGAFGYQGRGLAWHRWGRETFCPVQSKPSTVNTSRKQVLTGVLLVTILLAVAVLSEVIWTTFFAVTVAYVLIPGVNWLRDRGVPSPWASILATLAVTSVVLAVLALVGFVVYRRIGAVADFVATFPAEITLEAFGFSRVISVGAMTDAAVADVSNYAVSLAAALPTISLKIAVFAFVVFGLLLSHETVEEAILSAIPPSYTDLAEAFGERTRNTLYAIYVLQVATGVGTFFIALPVFFLLGYEITFTLAFLSGALQFLPIVGPSILLAVLAIYEIGVGNMVGAVLVLTVGGFFIAWVPDIVIRPRLASYTGRLPGTLYFIGFIGGLLTVGAVGIIAGPLAVAWSSFNRETASTT